MDSKVITTLELDKVLDQLGNFAAFSGGQTLIATLAPTSDLDEARYRQQETTEARALLDYKPALTLGGTRDVRQSALDAERDITLTPETLLDVKATLQAGAALKRAIEKLAAQFPSLAAIAGRIEEGRAIVAEIGRVLGPRGEVLDSASEKLATLRYDLRRARRRVRQGGERVRDAGRTARGGPRAVGAGGRAAGRG